MYFNLYGCKVYILLINSNSKKIQKKFVMKQAHPNNIQIGHLNIDSMGGFKMFELKEILASNCFDIFVVGETKLDSTFPTS